MTGFNLSFRFFLAAIVFLGALSLSSCNGGGGGGGGSPAPAPAPAAVSVNGTLNVPSFNAIDSDVNNPEMSYASNNSPAQAQPLSNPAIAGGFVCANPTGFPGDRFQFMADNFDYYRVTLAAGQVITLSFHLPASLTSGALNLDLRLLDAATQNPIDVSLGQTSTETVTAPADGAYLIEISAVAGATNYILSVGQPTAAAATVDTQAEFVPGEIIVRFKDTSKTAQIATAAESLAARAASVGLTPLSGDKGRPMLMRLEKGARRTQAFRALGIIEKSALPRPSAETEATHKLDTVRAVRALRARADVATADLNYIRRPTRTADDTFYSRLWNYPLIHLPQAWDITTGNSTTSQVIVAVIDTGVVSSHPDLAGKLIGGYDFISDPANAMDGDGIDPNPEDPGDNNFTSGTSSFHGTHVAGIVAAASNNQIGITGVSWGAEIMPLRVLGAQGGTSYDLIQAVRYASGQSNTSGTLPARRADIINLSLGGGGYSQSEQDAYSAARNAGVIIIAAAGNENTSRLSYPAAYDGVISVSAVGPNSTKAPYSNFGDSIDVAAPGGDMSNDVDGDGFPDGILSTLATQTNGAIVATYNYYQGTSMAAPHVAGVAALMKALHPNLTPTQFDAELAGGTITQDLGAPGRDNIFGEGLIDALLAVQRAQVLANGGTSPLVLMVTPTTLNFGLTRAPQTLTLASSGGPINNIVATRNADWLTITGSGLGGYSVAVNDTGLAAGVYAASIRFTSSAATVTVPVTLQVRGAGIGDAGLQYILLIDEATNAATHFTASTAASDYRFTLGDVPPGNYFAVAGTDLNNDGFICDAGEACGIYPTLDLPTTFNVGASNITGLDFTSGFTPIFGAQSTQASAQRGYARPPRR